MGRDMQKYVLIAAGGNGTRMDSKTPKQFLELSGKPLILHAIDTFLKYDQNIRIVLILPEGLHPTWNKLCQKRGMHFQHVLSLGGPTRFHSVKNGLRHVDDNSIVAVHDAGRPLVSLELISRVFNMAEKFGSAIPVTDVFDSVRLVQNAMSKPLDRKQVRLVQTPQCFNATLLKKAYTQNYRESFTDDATVFETLGERLYLVEGSRENIKITLPVDLITVEALLKNRKSK